MLVCTTCCAFSAFTTSHILGVGVSIFLFFLLVVRTPNTTLLTQSWIAYELLKLIITQEQRHFSRKISMTCDCVICTNTSDAVDVMTLPCGHSFHSTCIAQWLWHNSTCPICRLRDDDSDTSSEANDNEVDSSVVEDATAVRENNQVRSKFLSNILRRKSTYADRTLARKSMRLKEIRKTTAELKKTYNEMDARIRTAYAEHKRLEKIDTLRFRQRLSTQKKCFDRTMKPLKKQRANISKRLQRGNQSRQKLIDELLEKGGFNY